MTPEQFADAPDATADAVTDERVRTYGPDGEPHDNVVRTKSGRALTQAELDELAAEAAAETATPKIHTSEGMTCARCERTTSNNQQGHYWAWCSVTRTVREFHFCCPGDCALEAPSAVEGSER